MPRVLVRADERTVCSQPPCAYSALRLLAGNGWAPVDLDLRRILAFERKGHLKIPGLIGAAALPRLQQAVDQAFDDSMLAAVVQKIRVLVRHVPPGLCVSCVQGAQPRAHGCWQQGPGVVACTWPPAVWFCLISMFLALASNNQLRMSSRIHIRHG